MGKIAGYPMRPIKRRTVVFGRSLDAPREGAILGCGHVIIRPPSELDRIVGKTVQCYACPREERSKATEPQAPVPASQSMDFSPLLAAMQEIKEKLSSMDQRITQVEDVRTTPAADSQEDAG